MGPTSAVETDTRTVTRAIIRRETRRWSTPRAVAVSGPRATTSRARRSLTDAREARAVKAREATSSLVSTELKEAKSRFWSTR